MLQNKSFTPVLTKGRYVYGLNRWDDNSLSFMRFKAKDCNRFLLRKIKKDERKKRVSLDSGFSYNVAFAEGDCRVCLAEYQSRVYVALLMQDDELRIFNIGRGKFFFVKDLQMFLSESCSRIKPWTTCEKVTCFSLFAGGSLFFLYLAGFLS